MRASEMAELDPRAIRSAVHGIPSIWAICFTFSWEAWASAALNGAEVGAAGCGMVAATGAATGSGAGVFAGRFTLTFGLITNGFFIGSAAGYPTLTSSPIEAIISSLEAPDATLAWIYA